VNAKRIYRLYVDEGLTVRTKPRKRLVDGRWFRTLTVLDVYTREALALVADRSLTGVKVAAALTPLVGRSGAPTAITVDNGGEFVSRAMDSWADAHDVRLEFIRPGKPVENAFIESFNGRLRDECLNAHVFASTTEALSRPERLAAGLQSRPPAQRLARPNARGDGHTVGRLTCAT
jgi:putative transposase